MDDIGIIVIIILIARLALCYPIMSHATLNLFYHVSMLTLESLNMTCTLVATSVILLSLECSLLVRDNIWIYVLL